MNLILQAIKALLRKLENSISVNAVTLSKKIAVARGAADNAKTAADNAKTAADNAKTTADNAKTAADNAKTTADNAKTAADNAQTTANKNAFPVLTISSLEGTAGVVSGKVALLDGMIYAIRTNLLATTYSTVSYIKINGTKHAILARYPDCQNQQALGNLQGVHTRRVFQDGMVNLVQYCMKKDAFILITGSDMSLYLNRDQFTSASEYVGFLVAKTTYSSGNAATFGVSSDLILSSSTPDSTKRFKITVDDSGILTATEVTA